MTDWKRIRGLKRLVHDGVAEGARFVEKHHRHAADKPFDILTRIEPIAAPTRVVRQIHDGVLTAVYGSIQGINKVTEAADDWVVERLEQEAGEANGADGGSPPEGAASAGADAPREATGPATEGAETPSTGRD